MPFLTGAKSTKKKTNFRPIYCRRSYGESEGSGPRVASAPGMFASACLGFFGGGAAGTRLPGREDSLES